MNGGSKDQSRGDQDGAREHASPMAGNVVQCTDRQDNEKYHPGFSQEHRGKLPSLGKPRMYFPLIYDIFNECDGHFCQDQEPGVYDTSLS